MEYFATPQQRAYRDRFTIETNKSRAASLLLFVFTFWISFFLFSVSASIPPVLLLEAAVAIAMSINVFAGNFRTQIGIMRRRFVREAVYTTGSDDAGFLKTEAVRLYRGYLFRQWKESLIMKIVLTLYFMFIVLFVSEQYGIPTVTIELAVLVFFVVFMLNALLYCFFKQYMFAKEPISQAVRAEQGRRGKIEASADHRCADFHLVFSPIEEDKTPAEQIDAYRITLKKTIRLRRTFLWIGVFFAAFFQLFGFIGLKIRPDDSIGPLMFYLGAFVMTLLFAITVGIEMQNTVPTRPAKRIIRELGYKRYRILTDIVALVDPDYYLVLLRDGGLYTYSFLSPEPKEGHEVLTVFSPVLNKVVFVLSDDRKAGEPNETAEK